MKREPGYYWVVYYQTKQVAFFNFLGYWNLYGRNDYFYDKDFKEIFEDKICPP